MGDIIRLVGPDRAVEIFDVRLCGGQCETLTKLIFTLALIAFIWALGWAAQASCRMGGSRPLQSPRRLLVGPDD